MLLGEKGSKKRDEKVEDKEEIQSMRSGISKASKRSMKKEDVIINEA